MDGHAIVRWTLMLLGAALVLFALTDVFLTVLYARMGNGILSHRLACWAWYLFRAAARPAGRYRDTILSLCGPFILVLLLASWVLVLMIGGALISKPGLGTGIQATQGPTPTDFATALYLTGDAMTTVGTSDLAPKTAFYRLFYTFMSFVGISVVTLTVTFLLQIYNALQHRNTFVSKIHYASGNSGDAVELLAGLGSGGEFDHGYTHLTEIAAETTHLYESHHFYPVLLYFRFRPPHYALARAALVTFETITLIKSALDEQRYAWLKESAAVVQIWNASLRAVVTLSLVFLPGGVPEEEPDAQTIDRWRRRYRAALPRLRQAGIQTMADPEAGEEVYVNLRARWDRYIRAFCDHMMHSIDVIDPAGERPEATMNERPEFTERLRAVG